MEQEDESDDGDLAGSAGVERGRERYLWDGWLTCVTACTDESGSYCLGCLMRMGMREEG